MAELDWVQTLGTFGVCIAAGIVVVSLLENIYNAI